jgi:hypothetical protein
MSSRAPAATGQADSLDRQDRGPGADSGQIERTRNSQAQASLAGTRSGRRQGQMHGRDQ